MLPDPAPVPTRSPRFFYGWLIVAAGFAANIAYSEQFNSTYGVFIAHVGAETGWGRTALAGVKTVARVPESVVAAFIGPVVDRYGARWLMVGGGVIMSASFMLLATIQELWQLFLILGLLLPVGAVCLGGFVTTVTISNWFVLKRGRAIGIVSMGGSLGTMVLPIIASLLIETWNWRVAWFAMGVGVLVLLIPAALFVRRRPEDLGLQPDGVEAPSEMPTLDLTGDQRRRRDQLLAADVVWRRRDIIRSPVLWILAFAWGFQTFAITGTNVHMVPFLHDFGAPLFVAAAAVSLRSGIALVAQPVWGYIVDRVPIKPIASLQFVVTAAGIAMWLLPATVPTVVLGLVLFGLGGSGGAVVSEMIWAGFYGRLSLGAVRGIAYPLQNILGAFGPLGIGLLYDLSGSYASAFLAMAIGSLIAAGLVQLARPPRPAARLQSESAPVGTAW
jgi:MFS family permease